MTEISCFHSVFISISLYEQVHSVSPCQKQLFVSDKGEKSTSGRVDSPGAAEEEEVNKRAPVEAEMMENKTEMWRLLSSVVSRDHRVCGSLWNLQENSVKG